MTDRVPPHDLDAERAVLGAMLLTADAITAVLDIVGVADFHAPSHGHIFDAIDRLTRRGEPADTVTVKGELAAMGVEDAVPDAGFTLFQLLDAAPSSRRAATYARIVAGHAATRRTIALALELVDDGYTAAGDPVDRLERAEKALADIARPIRNRLRPTRAVNGATFILDSVTATEAVWGDGDQVLWSPGEPLLIVGPPGIGKTTIAGQLALAMIGLRPDCLGYTVRPVERLLYLALDRPEQIRRSLARMTTEDDRDTLRDRLVVWKGPVPADFGTDEAALTKLAVDHGATAVIVDSLKDAAVDLVKDDVGSRLNRGLQLAVATGIEVCALHHQRKGVGGAKPKKLEDVYGSTWLTSGVGSVILLWGEPGDPVVQLAHLKQPAEPVGPLTLIHDHAAGTTAVSDKPDPLEILRRAARGITARVMAASLTGSPDPNPNDIAKAQRQLDRLVREGLAHRQDGARGGYDKTPATWFATTDRDEP